MRFSEAGWHLSRSVATPFRTVPGAQHQSQQCRGTGISSLTAAERLQEDRTATVTVTVKIDVRNDSRTNTMTS
jgi:hypothetical protein